MRESKLSKLVMLLAPKLGSRLFRNQVGSYMLADGRYLSSGLCVGSSDLIGWTSVTITPGMVGRKVAIFTACETKSDEGELTPAQTRFIKAVNDAGGRAFVAYDEEDAARGISGSNRL